MAIFAEKIASQGFVVFVPDYRGTPGDDIEHDITCSIRYSLSVAAEHGGDLTQPVTEIGWSASALFVFLGLDQATYGPGGTFDECFTGVPNPDVIVSIDGCYNQSDGLDHGLFDEYFPAWSNTGTHIVLVAGTDDDTCEPWQAVEAADTLRSGGFDATLVEIDGGNHFNVVFHDIVDDEFLDVPDDPAGNAVVQTVLDAIDAAR